MKGKMSYDGKMMRPKFKYDDIPSHYATDRNKKGLRKGFYEGISLMKATEGLGRTLEEGDTVPNRMLTELREPEDAGSPEYPFKMEDFEATVGSPTRANIWETEEFHVAFRVRTLGGSSLLPLGVPLYRPRPPFIDAVPGKRPAMECHFCNWVGVPRYQGHCGNDRWHTEALSLYRDSDWQARWNAVGRPRSWLPDFPAAPGPWELAAKPDDPLPPWHLGGATPPPPPAPPVESDEWICPWDPDGVWYADWRARLLRVTDQDAASSARRQAEGGVNVCRSL